MERDNRVVVFGEDVGYFGGVFRCTEGLQRKYGESRCFDAPISEGGIIGIAVGMGAYGLRPVRRDPVRRLHLSRLRPDRLRGGAAALPLGRRIHARRWWSARPTAAASSAARPTARAPRPCSPTSAGLKTVIPSNPYDAKGLLIAAIEDDDPVIFLEPKRLYNGPFDGQHDQPVVPWAEHPLGEVPGRPLHGAAGQGRDRARRAPM